MFQRSFVIYHFVINHIECAVCRFCTPLYAFTFITNLHSLLCMSLRKKSKYKLEIYFNFINIFSAFFHFFPFIYLFNCLLNLQKAKWEKRKMINFFSLFWICEILFTCCLLFFHFVVVVVRFLFKLSIHVFFVVAVFFMDENCLQFYILLSLPSKTDD